MFTSPNSIPHYFKATLCILLLLEINVFFFGLRNVGEMVITSYGHGGKMAIACIWVSKLMAPS